MLKLEGADARIKAGEFQLHTGMTPAQIIDAITEAPSQSGVRVTIKEGARIGEIADQLAAADLIDKDRFLALAMTGTFAACDFCRSARQAARSKAISSPTPTSSIGKAPTASRPFWTRC